MNQVIAVFKNRNHTIAFNKYLRKIGIPSNTISTPRELSAACGISVIFPYMYLTKASLVVNQYRLQSFQNFYRVLDSTPHKKYLVL